MQFPHCGIDGNISIRDTPYDGVFIALYVNRNDEQLIPKGVLCAPLFVRMTLQCIYCVAAGFDGIYTYFAATGFTHGSTLSQWRRLAQFCRQHNALFIPSVGPGYDDTRVRPWNSENTRARADGQYVAGDESNGKW